MTAIRSKITVGPPTEVPLDADTLLALWQGIARALLRAHEQSGYPPARIETGFRMMSGLWGAGRSGCARGRRDCAPPMVGAHGADVLQG